MRVASLLLAAASVAAVEVSRKHHKKHHGKRHNHKHHHARAVQMTAETAVSKQDPAAKAAAAPPAPAAAPAVAAAPPPPPAAPGAPAEASPPPPAAPPAAPPGSSAPASTEQQIMGKMKQLEDKLEHSASHNVQNRVTETGKLDVNGPLPADFNSLFAQSVAKATMAKGLSCPAADIHVVETNVLQTLLQTSAKSSVLVELVFQGPAACVNEVQQQAGLPDSPLVRDTPLYTFLVAKEDPADVSEPPKKDDVGVDIDTEMPYGELEPFGREDTAQELTEDSIKESDAMVDQIERAQVAEEKRSVFRALTRLRGAAITSFDGVARSQTGNIDEYNKGHKWRRTHPLHHLAADENDVTKWSFPATSD